MTKIPLKRFPKPLKYCPLCECPVIYFGTVHKDDCKNMVRCLNEECGNTLQPEQALDLRNTYHGGVIWNQGYSTGYDSKCMEGVEDLGDIKLEEES
jgi:hypothetical protein